jgi:hypothetical protein
VVALKRLFSDGESRPRREPEPKPARPEAPKRPVRAPEPIRHHPAAELSEDLL